MTRSEIEAALAVCEKATPGPWEWDTDKHEAIYGPMDFEERWAVIDIGVVPGDPESHLFLRDNDADFIASARTLLPHVLRALLRALPVVEAARSQDKAWRDGPQRLHNQGWCDACVDVQRAIREHDRQESEEAQHDPA